MVEDQALQSILVKTVPQSLEAAAKKLLDTANANGGVDNSTVILARYDGP
jgi:serine/threonine protein phosphatase PrpC